MKASCSHFLGQPTQLRNALNDRWSVRLYKRVVELLSSSYAKPYQYRLCCSRQGTRSTTGKDLSTNNLCANCRLVGFGHLAQARHQRCTSLEDRSRPWLDTALLASSSLGNRACSAVAHPPGTAHACPARHTNEASICLYTEKPPPATATIMYGRKQAAEWLAELRPPVVEVTGHLGRPPGLHVVHIGERADSELYVSRKLEACSEMGVAVGVTRLPADTSPCSLYNAVDAACADATVDGVLVQLPLPPQLDEHNITERLDARKDVDGFHPVNMGRMLARGAPPRFVPATALGVMELLSRYRIDVRGKNAVVLGDSNIVGTPLSVMLRDAGASIVTLCHRIAYSNVLGDRRGSGTLRAASAVCLPRLPGPFASMRAAAGFAVASRPEPNEPGDREVLHIPVDLEDASDEQKAHLADLTRTADILIVAIGCPEFVRGSWIKPGATVIDVGINVLPGERSSGNQDGARPLGGSQTAWHEPGRILGDVAFQEALHVASAVTPVPRGVGPMTIAAVVHNVILAAQYRAGLQEW